MSSPSVLMVLPNDGLGGAQVQARLVARHLNEDGVTCAVAVGGGSSVDGEFDLPTLSSRHPWRFLRALRKLRRELHADVVHGHGLRTAPYVALSGARGRFATCHGLEPAAFTWRSALVLRLLPVRVVACGEGPRLVMAARGVHSVVVNNIAPTAAGTATRAAFNEHFGTDPNHVVAYWPARFSREKGHDRLLELMELVRDEPFSLVCSGDGPLRHAFEATVSQRGLSGRVIVRDHEPDAARWLSATDVFLCPSLWEGQALVMLEALRAGLPLLTVTASGNEDLLIDGRNGRRVQDVRTMADVLTTWMHDLARAPRDPALSATIIAQHEAAPVVAAYRNLYDRAR